MKTDNFFSIHFYVFRKMSSFDHFEQTALYVRLGLTPVGEDAKNLYFRNSRGEEVEYSRTYVDTLRAQFSRPRSRLRVTRVRFGEFDSFYE